MGFFRKLIDSEYKELKRFEKIANEIDALSEEMEALSKAVSTGKETVPVLLRLGELERKFKLPTSLDRFKRIKELAPESDSAKEADYYIKHFVA